MATIPQTGLIGSEQALKNSFLSSMQGLQSGTTTARRDLRPFDEAGVNALNLQQALSGALGAPSQAAAFADFQASPGQEFLQQRGTDALLANSAAIGGLGGGNVRSALQEQGIGFAQQDFQNQFDRLGGIANQGLQAAGQQANIASQDGQFGAGLTSGAGQNLAAGRTRAGEQLAGGIQNQSSALQSLFSGATGNLSNILSGAGQGQAASNTRLAELLQAISSGQAAQSGSLPGIPGAQQTPGILGGLGQLAGGVGGLIGAF